MDRRTRPASIVNWRDPTVVGIGMLGAMILIFAGLYHFEPVGEPAYVDVKIDSYEGTKGSYFTVESLTSDKTWKVNAHGSPFSHNYTGPAVLAISKGRCTGITHYNLLHSKRVEKR